MKRSMLFIALLCCLVLPSAVLGQSTGPGGSDCQDAAGGPIPCPTDEPRPTEPQQPEPQPEQPRPEDPQLEDPEPEQPDDSTVENPLRPSVGGDCQLATFGTVRVNVRQSPAFDAAVIGTLSPDTLYDVESVVVSGGETWLGVAGGWVHSSTVVYDGDCPVREVRVVRADYRVMIEELPEPSTAGGLYPTQRCVELFDGTVYCYTILMAIANDPDDTETTKAPGPPVHIGCWVEWPGIPKCIAIPVPGHDWDPQPPSFPYPSEPGDGGGQGDGNDGSGEGGGNDDEDQGGGHGGGQGGGDGGGQGGGDGGGANQGISQGAGQSNVPPYCYDQNFLTRHISPDDQDTRMIVEDDTVLLGILKAPDYDPEPQPCRFDVPIIRFDEPAEDGSFPLDIIEVIIQWPPPILDDETSPLIPLARLTPNHIVHLDMIRVGEDGDFCAPTAPHGFENCPDDDER